jgi:chemotaxis protein methyltransferase CheR
LGDVGGSSVVSEMVSHAARHSSPVREFEKIAENGSGTGVQSREFAWTDADFDRVQTLIYQRAGISLHDGKHAMVYSRLSRRLRDTEHQSFKSYLSWLDTHDGPEWQEFVNALTTNLTSFFREHHHFEILATHLKSRPVTHPWRVWCNAASTGEEPYSIAMTAVEVLGEKANFALMASDIDSKVLASAAQGVYRMESLKGISEDRVQRFFLRGKGGNEGMARVKPELQRLIQFTSVNLIRDDWPFREPFDVVFCRNVMIYFDASTQRTVLERIHRVMAPGALLFVGHAENFSESRDLFVLKGKTVYERR